MLHALIDRLVATIPEIEEHRKVRWSLDVDPIDLY
jgi:primosomal protein N'